MPLSAIRYKSVELVIIRTEVTDSGRWIILGGVLQMAAVSCWGGHSLLTRSRRSSRVLTEHYLLDKRRDQGQPRKTASLPFLGPVPRASGVAAEAVGRAADAPAATVENVGVDHCGLHVVVAQQLLHRADVVAV